MKATLYIESSIINRNSSKPLDIIINSKYAVIEDKAITLTKSFMDLWKFIMPVWQLPLWLMQHSTWLCRNCLRGGHHGLYFGDSYVHLHCNSRDYTALDEMRKMHRPKFMKPTADIRWSAEAPLKDSGCVVLLTCSLVYNAFYYSECLDEF